MATLSHIHTGISDFISSLKSWRIWYALAIQDILVRYRGSTLGPFWITISTAITAVTMGYLYGVLFGIDRTTYLPYFTTGIISWTFISMIINESTKILIESKSYLENIQVPCLVYVCRLIFRNVIVLAHSLPVYVVVALIYKMQMDATIFLLIPGMLILCINALFYGTLVAFMSARFPDVGAIVSSLLQVLFFITPIMWSPTSLPERFHVYLLLNPFYYFINMIRKPLLGVGFDMTDMIGIAVLTILGMLLFFPIVRVYSRRVVFWV